MPPARFYVPRLILIVGTIRARHSECHSRHSFTHNCSTHRFPRYCMSWKGTDILKAPDIFRYRGLIKWRLPTLPQHAVPSAMLGLRSAALRSVCALLPSPRGSAAPLCARLSPRSVPCASPRLCGISGTRHTIAPTPRD